MCGLSENASPVSYTHLDVYKRQVRNRIRNHEMAAYKDSLAHRLFREAQEIRKQLDNPNSK